MSEKSIRIGCAIPFALFRQKEGSASPILAEAFGGTEAVLDFCAEAVDAVELRAVKGGDSPDAVLDAVRRLTARGLEVTIHGSLSDAETFFAPYLPLLASGLQARYNVTVHPLSDAESTERVLRGICREITQKGYPIRLTLENQRMKEGGLYGKCFEVAEMARRIDSPVLSLCFDFGHQLSNDRKGFGDGVTEEFLRRVRHTHIHSLASRTHFPLDVGECLLEENISALISHGFEGVLQLELEPERYSDELDVRASFVHSAEILKTALIQVRAKRTAIRFYETEYESAMRNLKTRFDAAERCVALVGHAGYLIKLGDIRIAVDVAPCRMPISEEAKRFLSEWVGEADAFIVTHAHGDHLDRTFVGQMAARTDCMLPGFLKLPDGCRGVSDGERITLGDVTLDFFTSGHFRGSRGVPEYGFAVGHEGKTYLFPADVRDYSFPFPDFPNVSVLFAHLWLGRASALRTYDLLDGEFCDYVARIGAPRCCLAHLWEVGRTIEDMWSEHHVEIVRKRLPHLEAFLPGDLVLL